VQISAVNDIIYSSAFHRHLEPAENSHSFPFPS
jgi:hypothetical protein